VRLPFAASGWTSILIGRFLECGVPETQMFGYVAAATRLTAFQAPKITTCAN
jgi:hypothetical protein